MQKIKKIPMRMCMGCNEMKPKNTLIRVVKSADGEIFLDETGKKSGRGAYICKNAECFAKARKARRFEKAFSQKIDDSVYEALESELKRVQL